MRYLKVGQGICRGCGDVYWLKDGFACHDCMRVMFEDGVSLPHDCAIGRNEDGTLSPFVPHYRHTNLPEAVWVRDGWVFCRMTDGDITAVCRVPKE